MFLPSSLLLMIAAVHGARTQRSAADEQLHSVLNAKVALTKAQVDHAAVNLELAQHNAAHLASLGGAGKQ